jgi:hypothetical protein
MPYVENMQDDEQKTDPSLSPQGGVSPTGTGGGTVRLSGASAVPASGGVGTAGSAPGGAPTPAAGGSFASLDKYITANQGQATPLANKLTPGINTQYGNLDAANNAAISSINSQVASAPGYTPSNPGVLAAEAANPVSFTGDPNNTKQFQSLLNNSYGGPASAEGTSDYANQQSAINAAIAQGKSQTGTEAGREQLLSQNEATPTSGVTALNSAILSQDPKALSSIENAYAPFDNLLTNLQSGAQGADTTIAKEQADATSSSQAANKQIADQITALNTGVTGELTAAQQNATAQNAKVKADLAAGTPSPADLQALGITSDQWGSLSSADKAAATSQLVRAGGGGQATAQSGTTALDPTQFLTQRDPNAVFNAANVATPQDYAKAQAFQSLLQGMNSQAPATVINPSTAAQAGTAPTNLNQYDYGSAMNTATSTKADEVAQAQAYVDALQSGMDEQHAQAVAQQAGRQKKEQQAEATSMIGLPLAIASNLPVIGKPIANAVDTVVQAVSNPSWICTAMRKAGVLTQEEIDVLHKHLYRAIWYKPFSFLGYILLGNILATLADTVKIDWRIWKTSFYELPMRDPNPIQAVERYRMAFWSLAHEVWYKMTYTETIPND